MRTKKLLFEIFDWIRVLFFGVNLESIFRVFVFATVLIIFIENDITGFTFNFVRIIGILWVFKPFVDFVYSLRNSEEEK